MDQVNLGAWIDRSDTVSGEITAQQAALVHAVLGRPGQKPPSEGDRLPPLWHWYAFPPTAGMDALGKDGHPRLGDFMPPLRLDRRMWAGGSLEFHAPLHVGEPLRRRTRIAKITEKTGAAGEMVIVALDHEVHGSRGLAVSERQDLVYLAIPDSYSPPRRITPPGPQAHREAVTLSTPLLFRYSAITFNAHRIHYDLPYAQEIEHYPDLVVHGPLQAQLLMQMAVRERGAAPRIFSFRGVHPLFAHDTVETCAERSAENEWALCAVANGTHQTMQANAVWEV